MGASAPESGSDGVSGAAISLSAMPPYNSCRISPAATCPEINLPWTSSATSVASFLSSSSDGSIILIRWGFGILSRNDLVALCSRLATSCFCLLTSASSAVSAENIGASLPKNSARSFSLNCLTTSLRSPKTFSRAAWILTFSTSGSLNSAPSSSSPALAATSSTSSSIYSPASTSSRTLLRTCSTSNLRCSLMSLAR